ncbi:hypothetical protein BDV28DRAFT_41418 [Aspergillus coremiiformis]|uniref:Secreted protein n=1 Tax=Aspergillus coremiiformis TaxID=138285 RepID=A0A5N6ZH56_9EURO|nr:hypothetical protein BDV28DRAFT_41418 [Aspergillus coremiiformis]
MRYILRVEVLLYYGWLLAALSLGCPSPSLPVVALISSCCGPLTSSFIDKRCQSSPVDVAYVSTVVQASSKLWYTASAPLLLRLVSPGNSHIHTLTLLHYLEVVLSQGPGHKHPWI